MMDELIEYIRENLTEAEKWGQLAEELMELSQACMKMQRFYMPTNKPRVSYDEVVDSLVEEHADVCLCFKVLGWNDKRARQAVIDWKSARWCEEIRKRKEENKDAD